MLYLFFILHGMLNCDYSALERFCFWSEWTALQQSCTISLPSEQQCHKFWKSFLFGVHNMSWLYFNFVLCYRVQCINKKFLDFHSLCTLIGNANFPFILDWLFVLVLVCLYGTLGIIGVNSDTISWALDRDWMLVIKNLYFFTLSVHYLVY